MRRAYRGTYGAAAVFAVAGMLAAAGCAKNNRNQQNSEQSGGTNAPMQTEVGRDSAIPAPHGGAMADSDSARAAGAAAPGAARDTTRR
jgi:hypothetical protein